MKPSYRSIVSRGFSKTWPRNCNRPGTHSANIWTGSTRMHGSNTWRLSCHFRRDPLRMGMRLHMRGHVLFASTCSLLRQPTNIMPAEHIIMWTRRGLFSTKQCIQWGVCLPAAFAGRIFSRWQTLAQHITSNSCPSFDAASQAAVEGTAGTSQRAGGQNSRQCSGTAYQLHDRCATGCATRGQCFYPPQTCYSSAPTVLCTLWTMGSLTSMHEKTLSVLSQTALRDAGE